MKALDLSRCTSYRVKRAPYAFFRAYFYDWRTGWQSIGSTHTFTQAAELATKHAKSHHLLNWLPTFECHRPEPKPVVLDPATEAAILAQAALLQNANTYPAQLANQQAQASPEAIAAISGLASAAASAASFLL